MEFINKVSQAIQDRTQSSNRWASHLVVVMSFVMIATGYLIYNTIQINQVSAQSPSGINIIFPSDGANLEIGLPVDVEWTCGLAGVFEYSLYYSENKGIDWNLIDDAIPHINTSSPQVYENWVVPVVSSPGETNFRMKVEAYSNDSKLLGSSLAEKIEEIPTLTPSNSHPKVHGSIIVYSDIDTTGSPNIFTYNIDTDSRSQVSHSLMANVGHDVFGADVAWLQTSIGADNPADLALYNINTQNYVQVTSDGLAEGNTSLGNDLVAWQSRRDVVSGNTDIYILKVSTQTIKNITAADPGGELFRYQPKVDGNKIVWWDNRNGHWDIYMYEMQNINNGTTTRITTDTSSQVAPDMSGNRIVWQDNRNNFTGSGWDIYMYDLVLGTETRITTNDANQTAPVIDGDIIAWKDDRDGGDDIYIYDIETGASSRISIGDTAVSMMDIDDNRIVWQGENSGVISIALYEVSVPQLFTISYAEPDSFEFIIPNQANSGEDFEITATALKEGMPLTTFDGVITMDSMPSPIVPNEINIWNNGVSTGMYQIVSSATASHSIGMSYQGAIFGVYTIEIIGDGEGIEIEFLSPTASDSWFFRDEEDIQIQATNNSSSSINSPVTFSACIGVSGECLNPIIGESIISVGSSLVSIVTITWDEVGYLDGSKISDIDLINNVYIKATIDFEGEKSFTSDNFSIIEPEAEVASIVFEIEEDRTAVDMPFSITVSVFSDLEGNNPMYDFNEVISPIAIMGPGGELNPMDIGNSDPFSGTWENGSVTYNGYTISASAVAQYVLSVEHNGITASDTIYVDENAVYIDNPTTDTTWHEGGDGPIEFRAGGTIGIDHFKIFYSEAEDGNGDKIWNGLNSYVPYINYSQIFDWTEITIPGGVPQDDIAVKVESYGSPAAEDPIAIGVSEDFSIYAAGERAATYTSRVIEIDEDNPDVYITEFTGFNAVVGFAGDIPIVPDEADIQIFIKIADISGTALYPGDGWYELEEQESGADLNDIFSAFVEEIREVQFKIYMQTSEIADYQPWVSELELEYIVETLEDDNVGLLNFVGVSHKSVEREGSASYEIVFTPAVDYIDDTSLTIQLVLDLPGDPTGVYITVDPDILINIGSASYSRTIILETDETAEIANGVPFSIGAIVPEHSDLIVNNGVLLFGSLDITDSGADDDFFITIDGLNDRDIMPGGTVSFNALVSFVGGFNESVTLSSNIEDMFGVGVIESVLFLPAIITPLSSGDVEMRIVIEDDSGEHAATDFDITGTPEEAALKTISPKPSLAISNIASEYLNIEAVAEVEGGISSDELYPKFSFRLYQEDIVDPVDWTIDVDSLTASSVDGDEVTVNIDILANEVTDGETYVGYLRSTRHLWRKATTPTDGKITIDLNDSDYKLEFPELVVGDVAGTSDDDPNRDNTINSIDFSKFIPEFYKTVIGLLTDFDNNGTVNSLDTVPMFQNWFKKGELPGN